MSGGGGQSKAYSKYLLCYINRVDVLGSLISTAKR